MILRALAFSACVAGLSLGTGCDDKSGSGATGDDCKEVVDHMLTLLPEAAAQKAKKERKGLLKKCRDLSAKEKRCVLEATTFETMRTCEDEKPPEPS